MFDSASEILRKARWFSDVPGITLKKPCQVARLYPVRVGTTPSSLSVKRCPRNTLDCFLRQGNASAVGRAGTKEEDRTRGPTLTQKICNLAYRPSSFRPFS